MVGISPGDRSDEVGVQRVRDVRVCAGFIAHMCGENVKHAGVQRDEEGVVRRSDDGLVQIQVGAGAQVEVIGRPAGPPSTQQIGQQLDVGVRSVGGCERRRSAVEREAQLEVVTTGPA